MPSLNLCQIIGNLGRDPEMRHTGGGSSITSFTVAVSRRYQHNGEWQEETEWFRCVMWGEAGERFNEQMKKGMSVYCQGRLQTREWENKEGVKQHTTELIVDRYQNLTPRPRTSDRDDDEEERPQRRSGQSGGSRQQRGAPPSSRSSSRASQPTEDDSFDDLGDLDELPFS